MQECQAASKSGIIQDFHQVYQADIHMEENLKLEGISELLTEQKPGIVPFTKEKLSSSYIALLPQP